MSKCIICNENYTGYGHNAEPVIKGRCCDGCNSSRVIPTRIAIALGIESGSTKHTHRLELGFQIEPSVIKDIVKNTMGYDVCEVETIKPNSVFDVIVDVFCEDHNPDTFIQELCFLIPINGGE